MDTMTEVSLIILFWQKCGRTFIYMMSSCHISQKQITTYVILWKFKCG